MEHTITKIVIEVCNPMEKSLKKYQATVEQLAKAMRLSNHSHEKTEPTPYRALYELSNQLRGEVGAGLRRIFENIVKTWLHADITKSLDDAYIDMSKALPTDPYKLNDRIFINAKTGAPLTVAEYEEITSNLKRCFGYLFGETPDAMIKQAMALGKVLQGMDPTQAINISLDVAQPIVKEVIGTTADDRYQAQVDFASIHTAEMLQDIEDGARHKVMSTIIQAQKDRVGAKELEQRLFDSFTDINRDWRRVAESETANNFNNGYLSDVLSKAPVGKTIFMKGISGPGACAFCVDNVKGSVVVLLDGPPEGGGDEVTVEGVSYVAIWPGKSNFGRKAAEWWVASGIQHPHCRCTWIQYIPGFEAVHQQMEEAMARLSAGSMEA